MNFIWFSIVICIFSGWVVKTLYTNLWNTYEDINLQTVCHFLENFLYGILLYTEILIFKYEIWFLPLVPCLGMPAPTHFWWMFIYWSIMFEGVIESRISLFVFNIFVKESKLWIRNVKCKLERENRFSERVKKLVK